MNDSETTQINTNSSTPEANSQRISYYEKFGEAIPASVGKFCANTGQFDTLVKMLEQRILEGRPVTDWPSFVEPLTAPYVRRAPKNSNKDSGRAP